MSRLGIALGVSVGLHILIAVMAEAGSDGSPKKPLAPPVEITRVAMDGSALPSGKGNSSFNSPAAPSNPSFGEKYGLDAGVPRNIPIPKEQPRTNPPDGQVPQNQTPQNQTPPRQDPVSQNEPPTEFMPPMTQGPTGNSNPPSNPSRQSIAGNDGQKRSRGPNRVALPAFTVEPTVPIAMILSGVTNSVDVTVEIAADGTHSEKIVRSSGSGEVDNLVLDALKQWRWDPAAREGQAIASSQNFKFTFKPR
ncbi:MAG: TonB family protein [Chlorobia bacterium]|nr:TonB family protein [Fimbriimonadaceae bacterium]